MVFPRPVLLLAALILMMGLSTGGHAAEQSHETAGNPVESLIGTWYSPDGTVIIKANGTMNYRGTGYQYAVVEGMIRLGGRHGMTMIPYQRTDDKLILTVDHKQTVYSRK